MTASRIAVMRGYQNPDSPIMRQHVTKIVATIGPASSTPEMLEAMIQAGVSVVRLNFSHGTAQDHIERARMVREAAQTGRARGGHHGRPAGPQDPRRQVRRRQGTAGAGRQPFVLDAARSEPGDIRGVGLDYKELPNDVKPGDVLLLNDGLIMLQVEARAWATRCTPRWWWAASCPTTRASTSRAAA